MFEAPKLRLSWRRISMSSPTRLAHICRYCNYRARDPYLHFNASISFPGVSKHLRIRCVCCLTTTNASSSSRAWSSTAGGLAIVRFGYDYCTMASGGQTGGIGRLRCDQRWWLRGVDDGFATAGRSRAMGMTGGCRVQVTFQP